MRKNLDDEIVLKAIDKYPTPFYLYDEAGIRAAAQTIDAAFKWNKGFRNLLCRQSFAQPEDYGNFIG